MNDQNHRLSLIHICRNNPYIPNQNPIRAAAQRCRIAAGLF